MAWHHKIIQPAANDLFSRHAEELGGAGTGLPVLAIIIRKQDGRGRMKYDRAEQPLEFFRAVFREPADGVWLRGRGVQSVSPCPVDPGSRNTFTCSANSKSGMAVRFHSNTNLLLTGRSD